MKIPVYVIMFLPLLNLIVLNWLFTFYIGVFVQVIIDGTFVNYLISDLRSLPISANIVTNRQIIDILR